MRMMFDLMADSGWVMALKVNLFSAETPVGLHMSGFVPIEQNRSRRLAFLPAACAGRSPRRMERKGASTRDAPALTTNCLRLGLGMIMFSSEAFPNGPARGS